MCRHHQEYRWVTIFGAYTVQRVRRQLASLLWPSGRGFESSALRNFILNSHDACKAILPEMSNRKSTELTDLGLWKKTVVVKLHGKRDSASGGHRS
jgi:hypothetical protein